MEEREDTAKRFTGKLIINDAITITVEYEYSKLIRHLRNRGIVRIFRSADKQAGKITFEQEREEFARKLVVMETDITEDSFAGQPKTATIVWSVIGLDREVDRIINERVLPDEKEVYPNFIERLAGEQMEPHMRMNLLSGLPTLLLRSILNAVDVPILVAPLKAPSYDELERIPMIGVPRATRQTKPANKPRHPVTAAVYIALSETYDQIGGVIGAGAGIVGLAKAIQASNTYARRYTIIRDDYGDGDLEVPNETIDWIFTLGESRKMPTNGAIALELAAQKTIVGYRPNALAIRTLRQYVAKGDKLRGVARGKR